MILALVAVAAYLIGSVSFAVVASRLFALPDPRTYGSGNPGATNVLRSGSKGAALLTLAGDAAKGWLAVWLASRFAPPGDSGDLVLAAAALAVFVGHLFPVFHGFAGGKGVATAAGAILTLSPIVGLVVLSTWIAVAVATRISSLASLAAAAAAPVIGYWMLGNRAQTWVLIPIALLLAWRHRANIGKLLDGRESRIGR
jgi:glycerol-3-phosphate acyltransferase PlsY